MKKFFSQLFQDEKGNYSSKRFVGIITSLSICTALIANTFSHESIKPSPELVNAAAALAFGALGLTSIDKVFKKD
jgi:putative Ca2+/H+ antiporter (TMEM165/GDT1 family)